MKERSPIPICWVSREDLAHCRPDLRGQIEALNDGDVDYIGEKIGDALQDTYWLAMEIVLAGFFQEDESAARGNERG